MRFVDQRCPADPTRGDGRTTDGRLGDCLRCCIASMYDVPYEHVPHFAEQGGGGWWDAWRTWSRNRHGVDVGLIVPVDGTVRQFIIDPDSAPLLIACGPSPRSAQQRHAVVTDLDLNLVHDPHPARTGLAHVDEVYLPVHPYDPPPAERAPSETKGNS